MTEAGPPSDADELAGSTTKLISSSEYLKVTYANYIIFSAALLALVYASYCYYVVSSMVMTKDTIKVKPLSDEDKEKLLSRQQATLPPQTQQEALDLMIKISGLIRDGAIEFLKKEYLYLAAFCGVFSVLIYFAVDF